jgi:hypothetical protein
MQFGERFVASSMRLFASHGVTLRVGYDFNQYKQILETARPDHTIGVPFDPDLHDFSDGSAFWIVAIDKQGAVVHTQTLRLLNVTGISLADHLTAHFTDFPPPSIALDLDRSNYRAGPGAQRMTGRIAYHGEFWIGGAPGQFRGSGISSVLCRYGFWMAMQHWDPDHMFAFMLNAVAHKGMATRTGWMHTDPAALQWYPVDAQSPIETVLAYLHRGDIDYLLDLPIQVPTLQHAKAA